MKEILYFLGPTNFLSFVIFDGKIVFVAASKQTTTKGLQSQFTKNRNVLAPIVDTVSLQKTKSSVTGQCDWYV